MNKIKKTILTLALLITAVTGAWADQLASSYSSNATLNEVTVSASMEVTIATGVTVTINNGLNITSGTLTVTGPGTLVVNGKAGSNGGNGDNEGGAGGTGGAAISGNIIVQGGAVVTATGGNGGNGGKGVAGKGGKGGNGGNAFAGTLTYKDGTVTANGGNGGSGGWSEGWEEYGSSGYAGNAFTTSVNFVSSDYILTDGSNAITATQVTSKKKVVISPKVAVNSVTLAPTSATLTLGETEMVTLTATVDPTNATDPTVKWNVTAGADKVKLYKDENCSTEVGTAATDVLTVYAKCLAVGEATVTVTSNDDATKTAACTVTVIPSGPEVDGPTIVDGKPQWTFSMPGGNVTLQPEYYPQATVADGGVTAADADARATTDDPLVKVDATKLTGAKKLMYFVSNSGTAPAYDAEGWTDQLPTAEGFTQQGIVYVWYYPVGTDEGVDGATATYSDGDIFKQSITARIAAAPLWNAEFDLTNAPEEDKAGKWSTDIPEGGVVKGTPVTVTYSGSKKVIGVKAEKKAKAATKALAEATAEDLGKIAGADGNIYDSKDAAEAAGTTAVAMIAYVGTASDCAHGLAIALANESGDKSWSDAGDVCSGKTAVTGGTWRLPSNKDWQYMFIGCGSNESYSEPYDSMKKNWSGLASKLQAAGGTVIPDFLHWSSTANSSGEYGWSLGFGNNGDAVFYDVYEGDDTYVRACLAF